MLTTAFSRRRNRLGIGLVTKNRGGALIVPSTGLDGFLNWLLKRLFGWLCRRFFDGLFSLLLKRLVDRFLA